MSLDPKSYDDLYKAMVRLQDLSTDGCLDLGEQWAVEIAAQFLNRNIHYEPDQRLKLLPYFARNRTWSGPCRVLFASHNPLDTWTYTIEMLDDGSILTDVQASILITE